MLTPQQISGRLQALADVKAGRARMREIRPLRGVRGVPAAALARLLAELWTASPVSLPKDAEALHTLFMSAFEDGLVAIGLVAAALPDSPSAALELALRWVAVVDDHESADALGWLVIGPALLARGVWLPEGLTPLLRDNHAAARRAGVMALMAALPEPLVGPAAAGLRARLGLKQLLFVDAPRSAPIGAALALVIRDEDPHVRRAIGRVLRTWGQSDPDAAERFVAGIKGGVSRWMRDEAEQGVRRGRRRETATAPQAD